MIDGLLREIPLYAALSEAELDDVRSNIRDGFLATTHVWETGRLADARLLARFRAIGATRAAEGRSLQVVLRAYRVSALRMYDFILERASGELDQDEQVNFARVLMGFLDQLSDVVTHGYLQTSEQLASQQVRARRELFEDIVAGRVSSSDSMLERARTLDVDLPERPLLIVASIAAREESTLQEHADAVLHHLAEQASRSSSIQTLHLISGGRFTIIGPPVDVAHLKHRLKRAKLTAVIRYARSLAELPRLYEEATSAHQLLQEKRIPTTGPLDDAEARLVFLLAEISRASDRRDGILSSIAAPRQRPLREALDAYLRVGNAVSAANYLRIHPQTMRYRLRRIRELTGRDPSQGWDRFLLELALRTQVIRSELQGDKRNDRSDSNS